MPPSRVGASQNEIFVSRFQGQHDAPVSIHEISNSYSGEARADVDDRGTFGTENVRRPRSVRAPEVTPLSWMPGGCLG
jgi:hypothetical protein